MFGEFYTEKLANFFKKNLIWHLASIA